MPNPDLPTRIAAGRTDLVCDHLASGGLVGAEVSGAPLLEWCAYYGDVSSLRMLLEKGASLSTLGHDLGLNAAAFHGHWRLAQFLLERGAQANSARPETGETPLHSAMCSDDRTTYDAVVKVLLAAGANPDAATRPGAPTGCFMRDARTRGETPLHRAAAFGTENTIQMLLDVGATVDARDVNGESPLSWASWYRRPVGVLRLLCFGEHRVHPDYAGMRANLVGDPSP
ncbi:ankyrin repeat domain-containing protein [Usitatibacter palustris]|uniref:Uncharacterized protein n=1 Tax=Usitatibacter palustris TaxID=2732487 RepID=A0A6M4H544_9PROT|nr:ankyrin repeat domain-containing protein [Usitatibacter palustris]QJR14771.1 hypothetical protein DSM104440_01581 [Usitatibacter palustris]